MILSIIIINYKYKGLIRETLKYLKKHPLNVKYVLHVVDNNSKDTIGEMIKRDFPDVIYHQLEKNVGFGTANNFVLKKCKSTYVLLLNPDIITTREAIESLVHFMEKNSHVGLAGPRLKNPNGSKQYTCYRFPTILTPFYRRTMAGGTERGKIENARYLMLDKDHSDTSAVDWIQGSAMIIRTSMLQKVGLFDERFFLYMEDTDLCRRFWECGFPVYYVTESQMVHYHKRASANKYGIKFLLNKSFWFHALSFIKYMMKYWNKKIPKTIDKTGVVTYRNETNV